MTLIGLLRRHRDRPQLEPDVAATLDLVEDYSRAWHEGWEQVGGILRRGDRLIIRLDLPQEARS